MKQENRREPIWISHRGFSESACENTKESFAAAIELGFTHFEADLRATLDGHVVLCHNENFLEMGGPDTPIIEMRRVDVEKIQLNHGSRPLFFDELYDLYKDYKWSLDIKPESAERVIAFLANWAKKNDTKTWLSTNARFLCWEMADENLIKGLFPLAKFYARQDECYQTALPVLIRWFGRGGINSDKIYSLTPSLGGLSLFSKGNVKYFHKRKAQVLAFLPKQEKEIKKALLAGFDEILTDGRIYSLSELMPPKETDLHL